MGIPSSLTVLKAFPPAGHQMPAYGRSCLRTYGGALTVVDDAIPGPGHLEGVGTQYVKIVGDANPPPEGGPYLTMEADLGSINSGTIHAEFMMYIEGNGIGGTQGLRTSGTAATREPRISISWNRDTAEDPQDGEVNAYQ